MSEWEIAGAALILFGLVLLAGAPVYLRIREQQTIRALMNDLTLAQDRFADQLSRLEEVLSEEQGDE